MEARGGTLQRGRPGDADGFPVTRSPAGVVRSARGARDLAVLDARLSGCRACPRLVAWREEVALRAEFEAGALVMLNDTESRITDRFRGSGRSRGFEANGYGPRDLAAPNEDALGGNFFWAVRAEAQFPLGLPEEYGISGGIFADAGSVWGLDNAQGYNRDTNDRDGDGNRTEFVDGTVDDGMKVRASVGVSLFWTTPVGPLRFNLSKAVKKEDYDEDQPFDLSISTRF